MKSIITQNYTLKCLLFTAIFNTVIAFFLTVIEYKGGHFYQLLIFSQCIGLSICSITLALHHLLNNDRILYRSLITIAGSIVGAAVGMILALLITGINIPVYFSGYHAIQPMLLSIIFGLIIAYFFILKENLSNSKALLQEEKIKRLTVEKKAVETKLKLLQAQIEPHFLFNTLSNILSLLDTNPARGKTMLQDLTRYLRMSLYRTREKATTIGQEMEMIQAYINIYKVRMGDRLQCKIDIPDNIRDFSFPPMMIQPIVENAIKHGLEPRIDGGKISIKVNTTKDTLRVEISDTGLGFNSEGSLGVGLSNIRERLQALYDAKAKLILKENRPIGFKAIIEVPHVTA